MNQMKKNPRHYFFALILSQICTLLASPPVFAQESVMLTGDALPAQIKAIMPGELDYGTYYDIATGITFDVTSKMKKRIEIAVFSFKGMSMTPESFNMYGPFKENYQAVQKKLLREEVDEEAGKLRTDGKQPAFIGSGNEQGTVITHKSVEMPWGVVYLRVTNRGATDVSASFTGLINDFTKFEGYVYHADSEEEALGFINNVAKFVENPRVK